MAYDKVIDSAALDAQMTELADAIRAKAGTNSELEWVSGFKSAVESIQTGGGGGAPITDGYCTFCDYDGTVVAAWTAEELAAATELPPNPIHDGLTSQGWNRTLDDLKAIGRECDIGQMYITDDGKTRIYVRFDDARKSPMLGCCPNGTIIVDWGDGSTPDTLTGTSTSTVKWTPTHHYAEGGDYVITLTVSGQIGFYGTSATTNASGLLRYSSNADGRNQSYNNAVRRVELGYGITNISNYTFSGCYSLESVTMPNSIMTIGTSAFQNCHAIRGIVIPKATTALYGNVFYSCCCLERVIIPNGTTRFDGSTFRFCESLKKITLPSALKSIGAYLFYDCRSLERVVIPNGVTSIGTYAFQNCHSMVDVTIPDSVTNIGVNAFAVCCSLADVEIPHLIKSIESAAFSECRRFSNITIPDGVTSIAGDAYSYCYGISEINLPESVTSIAARAFISCTGLGVIRFRSEIPPTVANANAFSGFPTDCVVEVPASSLDAYKNATNYSGIAAQMIGV